MSLHPIQFLTSHMVDNSSAELPKYAVGAQVHDARDRPGIVTAHHVDHKHYNVRFGRGAVDVMHEDDLR